MSIGSLHSRIICFNQLLLLATARIFTAGSIAPPEAPQTPRVCFIIRTYWGHGDLYGDKSLRNLFSALANQNYTRWEALVLVMDNRPFPELRRIVKDFHDDRIWVHAELIHQRYTPKSTNNKGHLTWTPGYHNRLYNLTDSAIRACPRTAEWVVVTNGDNNYDARFLNHVMAAPPDTDAIAFNFYSRYQRPTATPCERFMVAPNAPMCKENELRFCQTDLAGNVYRRAKLLAENRRFGSLGTAEMSDGVLSEALATSGWKIHNVPQCLVDHGPSPQRCALAGDVWDDSGMASEDSFGGKCVAGKLAAGIVNAHPGDLEVVKIEVSYDPSSFRYTELLAGRPLTLGCIRHRNPAQWIQGHVFGQACIAPFDRPLIPHHHQQLDVRLGPQQHQPQQAVAEPPPLPPQAADPLPPVTGTQASDSPEEEL